MELFLVVWFGLCLNSMCYMAQSFFSMSIIILSLSLIRVCWNGTKRGTSSVSA